MRSLFIYLKNYKKETILAPLFKMLEASFELLVPLVMAAVIDKGIAQKDSPYIIRMCLVLIVLGIVGLICSLTAQYFSAKAAAGFGTGLRHALFEHIQHFGFSEMDEIGSSTLVTRMTSDVNQAQAGVNLVLRLFLRSPFIVFGAMAMSFMVDVKAAMVFVVVIPLLSVVVFGIMLITMPLYKKVQSYLDEILLKTRENLIGVRVLRAFNKEEKEKAEFEENNQMLLNEGAPAFLYVNDTLENSTAGILFSSVYNKLPDCISGFIANTASIRFPHAAAFVTVMIRFASFTSSTRICDI